MGLFETIDVLREEEEIHEDGDEISRIHGTILSLEEDEILHDMNEKELQLMKN